MTAPKLAVRRHDQTPEQATPTSGWFVGRRRAAIGAVVLSVLTGTVALLLGFGDESSPGSSERGQSARVERDVGDGPTDPAAERLYPNRPLARAGDREVAIGSAVTISGYRAAVREARWDEAEGVSILIATVTVRNVGRYPKPIGPDLFELVSEAGPALPAPSRADLAVSTLGPGQERTATVTFHAGTGAHYLVFRPNPLSEARSVWLLGHQDTSVSSTHGTLQGAIG